MDVLACVCQRCGVGAAWKGWVFLVPPSATAWHAEFRRWILKYAVRGGVFDALASETGCHWTRAALMRIIQFDFAMPAAIREGSLREVMLHLDAPCFT